MALAEGYTECLIDLAVVQERSSYLLVFVTVEICAITAFRPWMSR
jgi:hypothetical protein